MKAGAVSTIVVFLRCISNVAQESAPAEPYSADEAYGVSIMLLPNDKAHGFATGTVFIQQFNRKRFHVRRWFCLQTDACPGNVWLWKQQTSSRKPLPISIA